MNKTDLARKSKDSIILDKLSKDEDWYVRSKVAENKNTSPEILDRLSKDKNPNVRYGVAINKNTSPETLINMFWKEPNAEIRMAIYNKLGPEEILSKAEYEVLDVQDNYRLLNIKHPTKKNCKYLEMINPSTGLKHLEGVHPLIKSIKSALKWRNQGFKPDIITQRGVK